MNISTLTAFAALNGWKLIRRLNRSCQYKNLQNGRFLTVSIPDESDISDSVTELFVAKVM